MKATSDNPSTSAPPWLEEGRRTVEGLLAEHLKFLHSEIAPHSRLLAAVEYSLLQGGKRLRPLLVLEACRACGGSASAAAPAALAVECVHTFSLIHDDLPAMDDDDLRRGVPTNHKVFGEALAILAGDWLVAHAFTLLATSGAPRAADMVRVLSEGAKAMVVGQGADIEGEEQDADGELVEFIHLHKTARLIEASGLLGGLAAGAGPPQLAALSRYGTSLGLAFQIVDDLLDVAGHTGQLGKRARKDAAGNKQTFLAAFGEQASRLRARQAIDAAITALDDWGLRAEPLRELARFVLARDH